MHGVLNLDTTSFRFIR